MVGFVQEATGDLRLALYTTSFIPALGLAAATAAVLVMLGLISLLKNIGHLDPR